MKKRSSESGVFVALIRGINVGGKNIVRMEELRTACEQAGLDDVATFIQSGNVVFRSGKDVEALRGIFMKILEKEFSVKTEVIVIAADDYRSIVEHFPKVFSTHEDRKNDVLFMGSTDAAAEIAKEFGGQTKGLNVSSFGQAVYWSRDREDGEPDRYIRKLLVHKLYKQMTIRNSRTIGKILDLF